MFADVSHALAFVRLRLAQLADIGCNLADLLLVDPMDGELRCRLDGEGHTLGSLKRHRMAEAEAQFDGRRAPCDNTVADTDEFEFLLVPLGHADHHVVDQRARKAVKGLARTFVVGTLDRETAVIITLDRDGCGDLMRELTPGALDRDVLAIKRDLDARRDDYRDLANA